MNWRGRVEEWVVSRPWWTGVGVAVGAGGAGYAVGGPVLGFVVGVYGTLGLGGWRAAVRRGRGDRSYAALLDGLDDAIGDLRAGLMVARWPVPADARRRGGGRVVEAAGRVAAAYRISEALGTPLADVLERVDADLRATRRLSDSVRSETAGARATAVLLVGLPVLGLAMGAGLGADPVHTLLHTGIGAACAGGAVLLHVAGLVWTERLIRGVTG